MGNNVSPAKLACSSYSGFIKDVEVKEESPSTITAKLDYEFEIFLEDFLVNDKQFQSVLNRNYRDAVSCIGSLLFLHRGLIIDVSRSRDQDWSGKTIVENLINGTSASEYFTEVMSVTFVWSGETFNTRNGSSWVPCQESEVRLPDPETKFKFGFDVPVHSYGVKSPLVDEAVIWLTTMLQKWKEAGATFNDSLEPVLTKLKKRTYVFNIKPAIIPCRDFDVNLIKSTAGPPKFSRLFNVRLPYNPEKKTTELVDRFFSAFRCSEIELATHIIRWGCSIKPTITVIHGPGNEGKSTLVKFAQTLYGPFTTSLPLSQDTPKIVRTCFVSEGDNPQDNKKRIKYHPCDHLVFMSQEKPDLGSEFAGRKVHYLSFDGPIEKRDPEILKKVTTLKQLGSALGWCLKRSNFKHPQKITEAFSNLLSVLGSPSESSSSKGCANPKCTKCHQTSNEDSESDNEGDSKSDNEDDSESDNEGDSESDNEGDPVEITGSKITSDDIIIKPPPKSSPKVSPRATKAFKISDDGDMELVD